MSLSPETLPRHELVGLHVRVVESTDPNRVGVEGRIVSETMNTLVVREATRASEQSNGDRRETQGTSGERMVPKAGSTFEVRLGDPSLELRPDTTDEAAVGRKVAGTASEPVSGETHTAGDGVAYVTVDGTRLLSRPALRTETGVDSKWQ